MINNNQNIKKLESNTLYTNKEILEWFGLKGRGFRNDKQKQQKLKQLSLFADYELVGEKTKKILIKKVYEPYYTKKGSQNFQIIDSKLENYWRDNGKGLDTCVRVGKAMFRDKLTPLSESSTVNYAGVSKRNKYGKNYVTVGTKGRSIYAWGKYNENGEIIPLTEEENIIKDKLIKKYFGNTTEKQIFVQGMIDAGEITEAQAWQVLDRITNMTDKYDAFKAEFEEKINYKLGRGTYLIEDKKMMGDYSDGESAF